MVFPAEGAPHGRTTWKSPGAGADDLMHGTESVQQFYERRYAEGYLEGWPAERRERLLEVVRRLPLPAEGEALDFGCGNGVITDILRQALGTGWRISGCDLSRTAVRNATRRFPACSFLSSSDPLLGVKRFDLVFTHHVLEHVVNLEQTAEALAALVEPRGSMFHVLPCGNPGSLEHRICSLRVNGIDTANRNRFFFEDEGHLRRLSDGDLEALFARFGFRALWRRFANHYYGAVEWMSGSDVRFVLEVTNPRAAVDRHARRELRRLRRRLVAWWVVRYPWSVTGLPDARGQRLRRFVFWAGLPVCLPSRALDSWLKKRVAREWEERGEDPRGSEMYVFLQRTATVAEVVRGS